MNSLANPDRATRHGGFSRRVKTLLRIHALAFHCIDNLRDFEAQSRR